MNLSRTHGGRARAGLKLGRPCAAVRHAAQRGVLMRSRLIPLATVTAVVALPHWWSSCPAKDAPLDTSYLKDHAETRGFILGRPARAPKFAPDGRSVSYV